MVCSLRSTTARHRRENQTGATTVPKFNVTFERITDESAEIGDVEGSGFVAEGCSLRDAVHFVEQSLRGDTEVIEPSDSDVGSARWFTWLGGRHHADGDFTNVSLHMPDSVTASSRKRIGRLVGAVFC
ncbi:hypothetical protein [Hyphomicrobium sp. DY-1]|uniref:hypothetical protein n=1 Tax=Hyphomicrobium sp. DY-1 TaxID=3075650 RepID=UPI0039C2C991